MQPVVLQVEKGHCQRLAKAFPVAQADAIEHGAGVEHAAESRDQIQKRLRTEHTGVATRADWRVVEVADGELGRLIDAAGQVERRGAIGQAHRAGAARLATLLFRPGIQVNARSALQLLTAGPVAVQVDVLTDPLGQAVVGHGANGLVAPQQLGLRIPQGFQQFEDAERFVQGLLQGLQGSGGQGRKLRGVCGIAETGRLVGSAQGSLQAGLGEIRCAGDAHQAGCIPYPQGDRAALGSLHLLGLTPIHLHRGVAAAGGPQIPLANARGGGKPLQGCPQGRRVETRVAGAGDHGAALGDLAGYS